MKNSKNYFENIYLFIYKTLNSNKFVILKKRVIKYIFLFKNKN